MTLAFHFITYKLTKSPLNPTPSAATTAAPHLRTFGTLSIADSDPVFQYDALVD
jgi:hypothetical protein